MPAETKTKKPRPSGVTVTRTRSGGYRLRAHGPDGPDLRTVIPTMLGARQETSANAQECRTCLGNRRIRDGETKELRRCLDCDGTGCSS